MKVSLSILFILIFLGADFAQAPYYTDEYAADHPIYEDLIRQSNIPFKDIQRAFRLFAAKHPGKYKQYHRWESGARFLVKADGTLPSADEIAQAYTDFRHHSIHSREVLSNWTENGPMTMPENETGQPNGLGRVNEVVFEPGNSNTIYAGTPAAGLWKTTDGGANWQGLTDNLPSLGVSAIVVDKDDYNTIYIGTGDRDSFDSRGRGVMKSTDGGQTFVKWNTGISDKEYINDLIQDPNDGNVLIAAGYFHGIYRTDDGGENWQKMNVSEAVLNLAFHPTNSQIVYASTRFGKFFRSTDNGQTWTVINSGIEDLGENGSHRAFIAVSPASPDDVYLVRTEYRYLDGVYRSSNSGMSFTKQMSQPNILGSKNGLGQDKYKGQGRYDLTIAADPSTPGLLYVGGINIWESTDYGVTWARKSYWAHNGDPHADQHHITFAPNGHCYAANDGGIYYTTNGWDTNTEISSGLAIAQIYKLGQSRFSQNLVVTGFQDNGTAIMEGTDWFTVVGGDGMECQIDPTSDDYVYTELYYGDIRRSDHNSWFKEITDGSLEEGAWITPFKINPVYPNIIVTGRDEKIWRTKNARASNPSAVSWDSISSNLNTGRDIEISPVDGKLTYYSTRDGLFRCDDITADDVEWTQITLPKNRPVYDILVHPTELNTVYIPQGNYLFKSTDRGETWTNLRYNFPKLNIICLAYDKNSQDGIYAGTVAGVYFLEAADSNWTDFYTNLPVNVAARELEIYYDDAQPQKNLIRLATYGRGMWSSPLASSVVNTVTVDEFEGVEVFPNPAPGQFTLLLKVPNSAFFDIRIVDQLGRLMLTQKQISNGRHQFDFSDFPKGIYYLEVKGDSYFSTRKILID